MKIDLHLHSTGSDGVLSPSELVEKVCSMGVDVMAITDHDTFGGYAQLSGQAYPLRVLQGVEMSMADRKNMHLLGYGFTKDTPLHHEVERLSIARIDRARQMLALLREKGMPLDEEELFSSCHGSVGRPHIARMLVEKGYVHSVTEAFQRYLGDGRSCYVAGERLYLKDALHLMLESGFVPVMAHPRLMGLGDQALSVLLAEWQTQGLMGVEVYHPSAEARGFAPMDHMARRMGLLVTGGSDFHQEGDNHGLPGCTNGAWANREDDYNALLRSMEQQKQKYDCITKGGPEA